MAAERRQWHDQLIDYLIALEPLPIPDDNHELSFRASLRGALLIGKTNEDRQKWFDHFRLSYAWRSTIAHTGNELARSNEGDSMRLSTRRQMGCA
jgi:hypothetical protein